LVQEGEDLRALRRPGPQSRPREGRERLARPALDVAFLLPREREERALDLKRKDDWKQTLADGTVLEQHVLEAKVKLAPEDGGDADLQLCIETKTFRLLSARLTRTNPSPNAITFAFWGHSPTQQGVVVPGIVKIFVNGAADWSTQFALEGEEGKNGEDLNKIRFNTGVKDEQFAPPCP